MPGLGACLEKAHVTSCDCVGDAPPVCTITKCGHGFVPGILQDADLEFTPNAAGDACEPVVTKYVVLDPQFQPECEAGARLNLEESATKDSDPMKQKPVHSNALSRQDLVPAQQSGACQIIIADEVLKTLSRLMQGSAGRAHQHHGVRATALDIPTSRLRGSCRRLGRGCKNVLP